jgi:hypothetical protein
MRRFVLTALVLVPFGLALLAGCSNTKTEIPTAKKDTPPPTQQKGTGVEK